MPSPTSPGDATRRGRRLLRLLFFLSGAAGLAYEVILQRALQQVVGGTVESLTVVLVAYMGGLAAGAHAGGRLASRVADPLRAYGACELLIAAAAPLALVGTGGAGDLLGWAYVKGPELFAAVSFAVAGAPVLLLALLLGATLPLAVEADARAGGGAAASAGVLYGVNTLGAALGALLAGFVLVPALGMRRALLVAALSSAATGVAAIAGRRWLPPRSVAVAEAAARADPWIPGGVGSVERAGIALAYAASGLLAMVCQVAWTRATSLALGSSTYTFTIVVAAFVLGLGAGGAASAALAPRISRPELAFGALLAATGIAAAAVLPLFGSLPAQARGLFAARHDFDALMGMELVTLLALVGAPTLLVGALYPFAVRLLSAGPGTRAGRSAATAYEATTAGTIVGALLAGPVVLPELGVEGALRGAAVGYVVLGASVLALVGSRSAGRAVAATGVLAAGSALVVMLPAWDPSVLLSAPFMRDPSVARSAGPGGEAAQEPRVVFYQDDPHATVAVTRDGEGYQLRINGKTDASTFRDMPTQRMLAHIPLLLHGAPRRVCVVGMGSGVTAGSASLHPGVERVDQVEIAQAVIEAAVWFSHVNHDVLARPNVRLRRADGRVHMRHGAAAYDVVLSQPSNPWIAGIGNLFTEEYFRECRSRLARGGLMVAWMQTYQMSREAFAVVVRTFLRVFPDATAWAITSGDLLLVAGAGETTVDLDAVTVRMASPEIAQELRDLRLREPGDLWSHLALTPGELSDLAGAGGILNTDDSGWLELHAPRAMLAPEDVLRAEDLTRVAEAPVPFLLQGSSDGIRRSEERWRSARAAKRLALAADDEAFGRRYARAEELAREALAIDDAEPLSRTTLVDLLALRSRALVAAGRTDGALELLVEIAELDASDRAMRRNVAALLVREGRGARALPWLEEILRRDPGDAEAARLRELATRGAERP